MYNKNTCTHIYMYTLCIFEIINVNFKILFICMDDYMKGDLKLDHYITHEFQGVEGTLQAVEALHSGDCLRAVVTY